MPKEKDHGASPSPEISCILFESSINQRKGSALVIVEVKTKKDINNSDEEPRLLDYLLDRRIKIDHECGGMGICGTCRVKILESPQELPERNEFEQARLEGFSVEAAERLSCQIPPINGMRVKIPD